MSNAHAQATDWMAAAQALEEDNTTTWKPQEEGDYIAGKVVSVERDTGQNSDSTLVDLETQDGSVMSIWLSTVLERQWQKKKPEIGDVVLIKYHGERTSPKSGRQYKSYTLAIHEKAKRDFEDEIPY